MIEDLNFIKENFTARFLEEQEKTWKCPNCGEIVCCHNGICFNCDLEKPSHKKAKYRWNDKKHKDGNQRHSSNELQGLVDKNIDAPPRERAARQHVIDAFRGKTPSLIPFAFENESILKLAAYLLRHTTGSKATLYQYVFGVYRFSKWIAKSPDDIVRESLLDKKRLEQYVASLDDFVGDLQAEALAPGTIVNHIKGVKALYRTNGIEIVLSYRLPRRVKYNDRAPTPEELTKIADIREKVAISLLALGGFRLGTLVNLRYRHVKKDLEAGKIPLHAHVEAEITKGKYHDYDTFLGTEAVEYLKVYLDMRRKGTRNDRWACHQKCSTTNPP